MQDQVEILRAIEEVRRELIKYSGNVTSIHAVEVGIRLHNLYALLNVTEIANDLEYINYISAKKAA